MKKRINTIKDKILVQGGTDNELKNHEIRLNSDFSFSERVGGKVVNVGGSSLGDFSRIGYTSDNNVLQNAFEEAITYSERKAKEYIPSNQFMQFAGDKKLTLCPMVDTNSVTNMDMSFSNCYALVSIPKFDTSNVEYMRNTFSECYSLITIPQLDMSNVKSTEAMFSDCFALTIVPELNTSSVTNMNQMFSRCSSLTTIEGLDMTSVEQVSDLFPQCPQVTYAVFKNIGTSDCTKYNFSNLTAWGTGGDKNRQSIIDSLLTYSIDRSGRRYDPENDSWFEYNPVTIVLSSFLESLITPEELQQIQAKNYTIRFQEPYYGE